MAFDFHAYSYSVPKYNDLDDLIGTWVEDPEFDAAVKEMDQVDQDLWK